MRNHPRGMGCIIQVTLDIGKTHPIAVYSVYMPDRGKTRATREEACTALQGRIEGETCARKWIVGDLNAVTPEFIEQRNQAGKHTRPQTADTKLAGLCTTRLLETTGTGQATHKHQREIDHIIVDTASRSQRTTQTVIPAAASDGDHSIIQVDYTTTDPNPTKTGGAPRQHPPQRMG